MNLDVERERGVQKTLDRTESVAGAPAGFGLLEFALSGELMYIDRKALQWLDVDGEAGRQTILQARALPDAVTDLFEDLLLIVKERTEAEDWRRIEITSLICGASHRLLLRGFGIPDRRGTTAARVVITVEEACFDQAPLLVSWEAAGADVV